MAEVLATQEKEQLFKYEFEFILSIYKGDCANSMVRPPFLNSPLDNVAVICSIWMTSNHRFEPDKQQRRKNINIELGYCVIMLLVALIDVYLRLGVIGVIILLPVMLVYILYINPKFMNRKLAK